MAKDKITVKEKDIVFHPYEATIEFDFTYNKKKGFCKYQVYDTDTTDSQAGILIIDYNEAGGEDIYPLVHNWVDENIEFIPEIVWRKRK